MIETGNDSFAIFMSISHILGDGHTYYKFYNMIGDENEVISMKTQRNHDFIKKVSELKGGMQDD